ncbi:MAG: hypothetical protein NTZ70_03910 [Methylococcales bacterium]|nr:hypothetical protein [Methylococcales bacterium]
MCIAANEVAHLSPDNEDKMNLYKSSNRFCVLLVGCCLLLANDSYAVDFDGLQNQCAELGFKIKTPENGKCVLKLRKKVIGSNSDSISNSAPVISQSIEAANQRNYERQQRYAKDAEIEQKNREIEALRQQQAAIQLQQQQLVAAQKRQESSSNDMLLLMGILGAASGGYNRPPTQTYQPTNCTSRVYGHNVDTSCY